MELLVTVDDWALEECLRMAKHVLGNTYHMLSQYLLFLFRDEVMILGLYIIFILKVQ